MSRSGTSRWRAFTALVCLALIMFAAVVEAQHSHANNSREAQRCGVCATAHSPTLLARTVVIHPESVSRPLVAAAEAPTTPGVSLDLPCIRPPPTPESV
jgi:hypothetical protein